MIQCRHFQRALLAPYWQHLPRPASVDNALRVHDVELVSCRTPVSCRRSVQRTEAETVRADDAELRLQESKSKWPGSRAGSWFMDLGFTRRTIDRMPTMPSLEVATCDGDPSALCGHARAESVEWPPQHLCGKDRIRSPSMMWQSQQDMDLGIQFVNASRPTFRERPVAAVSVASSQAHASVDNTLRVHDVELVSCRRPVSHIEAETLRADDAELAGFLHEQGHDETLCLGGYESLALPEQSAETLIDVGCPPCEQHLDIPTSERFRRDSVGDRSGREVELSERVCSTRSRTVLQRDKRTGSGDLTWLPVKRLRTRCASPRAPTTCRLGRGRPDPLQEIEVVAFLQDNPKRVGSKARDRYELYKGSTNVAAALRAGARRADITHDLEKGFLTRRVAA